jgi:hypothetical protein
MHFIFEVMTTIFTWFHNHNVLFRRLRETEKQVFKTTPNSSRLSKHWCETENEEDVWDSLHPFGVQFKDNTTCDSVLNL